MMTRHSVLTSSLCFKNRKIEKFDDFSSDIDLTVKHTYLEMLSPL